jgi:uncharacterized protein
MNERAVAPVDDAPPVAGHQGPVEGAGLGLRRSMTAAMAEQVPESIDFFELAPENWIGLGGRFGRQLRRISESTPLVCHGLSLSIGGPAPLDVALLTDIKSFIAEHNVMLYSEHLSYTNDGGQLYDLLPMPFTEEAVTWTAERVRQAQDILEMPLVLENVSYYTTPKRDLDEVTFVRSVIEQADCGLLLDVNNVYVNSVNHGYDPMEFIRQMPLERVRYLHIAGHYVEPDGLIVDTHGADVIHPVWDLLEQTYRLIGPTPTLLERDFNIPSMAQLLTEIEAIHIRQRRVATDV